MTINEMIFSISPSIEVKVYDLTGIDLIFEGTADELIFNDEIDKERNVVSFWFSEIGYVKFYIA